VQVGLARTDVEVVTVITAVVVVDVRIVDVREIVSSVITDVCNVE
jgi:hypothetical protein